MIMAYRSKRHISLVRFFMSACYFLLNQTKKEIISFLHIPAWKKRELAGNSISAAIVTWYLLENMGDSISFINDESDKWPFKYGIFFDLRDYKEVTDQVVDALIKAEILKDEGREFYYDDEPDAYDRILRNIWF